MKGIEEGLSIHDYTFLDTFGNMLMFYIAKKIKVNQHR